MNSENRLSDIVRSAGPLDVQVLFRRSLVGEVPEIRTTDRRRVYEFDIKWCSYVRPEMTIAAIFEVHLYKLKETIVYMADILKQNPEC